MRLISIRTHILCLIFVVIALIASTFADDDVPLETDISVLPEAVLESIREFNDNFELIGFRIEFEDSKLVYEAEGIAEKKCYELEIAPDGEILEVEECD